MKLKDQLSQYWRNIQGNLFPWLEEELGKLTGKHLQLVTTLEMIRLEDYLVSRRGLVGRPPKDRAAIARAFVAKAIYNLPTTRALLDRLQCDYKLRRICGWGQYAKIPDETIFSRAFAEFSQSQLAQRVHQSVIEHAYEETLIGHISKDSTKIHAREKPLQKPPKEKSKRKRGRPRKDEAPIIKAPSRIDKQLNGMHLKEMLDDLPVACDVGTKLNSKGRKESWIGYKLHIDAADGQVPISCLLTSASTHDSQVAIPLATMTNSRVTHLYDVMDSAYDVPQIRTYSKATGHVPIIDINPRRNKHLKKELAAESKRQNMINFQMPEDVRYNERSNVERVNSRLKDDFGGRVIRVRGHKKVMTHLMFGIIALTIDQLMKLVE